LNLASLNRSSCVSKKWRQLASKPLLWKKAIHRELAFGIAQWAQCCGEDAIKDESRQEEFSSLPLNVVEYYKKYQDNFPERRAKDDLMLIWLPKTWHGQLTLNNLAKLGERYFPFVGAMINGWSGIQRPVADELGDQSIKKSYWALATKEIIPRSKRIDDAKQQFIFDFLSLGLIFSCNLPNALEAGVCFCAECLSCKGNEWSSFGSMMACDDKEWDYTLCQERIQNERVVVESRIPLRMPIAGLHHDVRNLAGAKALWKFSTDIQT